MIKENTFAAACYDQNSAEDLKLALKNGPDTADMAEWKLTADEWKDEIELALVEKMANSE